MKEATKMSKQVQKSGMSLDTFDTVSLYKEVPEVAPVTSVDDALSRVGNDGSKLLAILTEGLQSLAINEARESESGWLAKGENGELTGKAFEGTLADPDVVNPVVLQFAKLLHGYDEATSRKDAEGRKKAKEAAIVSIKSNQMIMEGLKAKLVSAT